MVDISMRSDGHNSGTMSMYGTGTGSKLLTASVTLAGIATVLQTLIFADPGGGISPIWFFCIGLFGAIVGSMLVTETKGEMFFTIAVSALLLAFSVFSSMVLGMFLLFALGYAVPPNADRHSALRSDFTDEHPTGNHDILISWSIGRTHVESRYSN